MDRFSRGFIAGTYGAIIMNIWSFISYGLNYAKLRFLDWASVLLFGNVPANTVELVTALFAHIIWSAVIGIIVAYLMPLITSERYLLKGALFGFISGFLFISIPIIFQVPFLNNHATGTTVSIIIGSLLWGIITAASLRSFDTSPRHN